MLFSAEIQTSLHQPSIANQSLQKLKLFRLNSRPPPEVHYSFVEGLPYNFVLLFTMRLGTQLLKRSARSPELGPFKFQELLPLQLKNQVSGKGEKGAGTSTFLIS